MERFIVPSSPQSYLLLKDNKDELAKALLSVDVGSPPCTPRSHRSPKHRSPVKRIMDRSPRSSKMQQFMVPVERCRLTVVVNLGWHPQIDTSDVILAQCKPRSVVAISLGLYLELLSPQKDPQILNMPDTFGAVVCLAFSDQGLLAIGYKQNVIWILDATNDIAVARCLMPGPVFPTSIVWADKRTLLVGDDGGAIHVYQLEQLGDGIRGLLHGSWRNHGCSVKLISLSTLSYVVTTDEIATIGIWHYDGEKRTLTSIFTMEYSTPAVSSSFCPWAPTVVAISGIPTPDRVQVWDVETRKLLQELKTCSHAEGLVWLGRWDLFVAVCKAGEERSEVGQVFNIESGDVLCDVKSFGRQIGVVPSDNGVAVATDRMKVLFFKWVSSAHPCSAHELRTGPFPLLSHTGDMLR